MCALESTDAAVRLRIFHRTICRVATAWIELVALGNITFKYFNSQGAVREGRLEGVQVEGGS